MRAPRLSLLAIVAANLVPLAGVALLGWSLGEVMLLFWMESAIIGVFNALRMLVTGRGDAVPLTLFFSVHFGLFMVVHLVFLLVLFIAPDASEPAPHLHVPTLLWGALALLVSHAASFHRDFLRDPDARARPFREWMFTPYPRVLAMHFTILGGGFLLASIGTPRPALAILVAVKTLVDIALHVFERRRLAGPRVTTA